MKVDLARIDRIGFVVSERNFHGENVYLVTPTYEGPKYDKDNLIFRSSVWSSQGEPVSLGFKKFFNLGEQLELSPPPKTLQGTSIVEKLDGSLLITSMYKGHLMARTRGAIDATALTVTSGDNVGNEVLPLLERYGIPAILESNSGKNHSLLFEWVSPRNQIVLKYPEPDLYLVGMVSHEDYSLAPQNILDDIAHFIGMKRPQRFSFDSVEDMVHKVKAFEGMEGVCLYSEDDQVIHKVKGDLYLAYHRAKENCNLKSILDIYLAQGEPEEETFIKTLPPEWMQYELQDLTKGFIRDVYRGRAEVFALVKKVKDFVETVRPLATRKEQASAIFSKIPQEAGMAFVFLDGKTIDPDDYRDLYLYKITGVKP